MYIQKKVLMCMDANTILHNLRNVIKNPKGELNYTTPFELLVAVMLSSQCTDKRVNMVTSTLFKKYSTPKDFANADTQELKNAISSINYFNTKAIRLKEMSQMLLDKYAGVVPSSIDELVKLPGVGRKSASVVMVEAFNQSAMPVDTHVFRVAKRLNLSKSNTVLGVEKDLRNVFDENVYDYKELHHLLILFGRYYCKAVNPSCKECKFRNICTEVNKCF